MILEWVLISAIPAVGALALFLVLQQWGKKHDPMGGRPGHIWKPDDVTRGPGED